VTDPAESRIVESWRGNAAAWTDAVRSRRIESRRRVTDGAIVEAVCRSAPGRVLDIGCGEGWLSRALTARGIEVLGFDVVPGMIDKARESGGGEFHVLSYESFAAGRLDITVDAAVCNFSLFGRESTEAVLRAAARRLQPGGRVVVQTLHPAAACGDQPYRDGWRDGSWDGCGPGFVHPAPWYFRTIESWEAVFTGTGYGLPQIIEPRPAGSELPASVIFVAAPT